MLDSFSDAGTSSDQQQNDPTLYTHKHVSTDAKKSKKVSMNKTFKGPSYQSPKTNPKKKTTNTAKGKNVLKRAQKGEDISDSSSKHQSKKSSKRKMKMLKNNLQPKYVQCQGTYKNGKKCTRRADIRWSFPLMSRSPVSACEHRKSICIYGYCRTHLWQRAGTVSDSGSQSSSSSS